MYWYRGLVYAVLAVLALIGVAVLGYPVYAEEAGRLLFSAPGSAKVYELVEILVGSNRSGVAVEIVYPDGHVGILGVVEPGRVASIATYFTSPGIHTIRLHGFDGAVSEKTIAVYAGVVAVARVIRVNGCSIFLAVCTLLPDGRPVTHVPMVLRLTGPRGPVALVLPLGYTTSNGCLARVVNLPGPGGYRLEAVPVSRYVSLIRASSVSVNISSCRGVETYMQQSWPGSSGLGDELKEINMSLAEIKDAVTALRENMSRLINEVLRGELRLLGNELYKNISTGVEKAVANTTRAYIASLAQMLGKEVKAEEAVLEARIAANLTKALSKLYACEARSRIVNNTVEAGERIARLLIAAGIAAGGFTALEVVALIASRRR